jgi:hypothetical protein
MCVLRIVLSFMTSLALPYFYTSHLSLSDFRKRTVLIIKRVFFVFSTILCKIFLILRRTRRDIINARRSFWKVLFFFSDLNKEFSWQGIEVYWNVKFRKNLSSGSRIVPCGRKNRRTDTCDEGNIVGFRSFADAPKNVTKWNWMVRPSVSGPAYKQPNTHPGFGLVFETYFCTIMFFKFVYLRILTAASLYGFEKFLEIKKPMSHGGQIHLFISQYNFSN